MHQRGLRKCSCSGFEHFDAAGSVGPGNCGLALADSACQGRGWAIACWSRQLCTMGLTCSRSVRSCRLDIRSSQTFCGQTIAGCNPSNTNGHTGSRPGFLQRPYIFCTRIARHRVSRWFRGFQDWLCFLLRPRSYFFHLRNLKI